MATDRSRLVLTSKKLGVKAAQQLKIDLMSRKPSTDYLNATFEELLKISQIQYGFNELEQGDWVHPDFCVSCIEKKELPSTMICPRPLSSWIMKGPLVVIPSEDELEKIVEWHYLFFSKAEQTSSKASVLSNILEAYVDSAFAELEARRKMLLVWKTAGYPTKQSECHPITDQNLKRALTFQRLNIEKAKVLHIRAHDTYAPESILCHCEGALALEEGVNHQLKKIKKTTRYSR